ncbi:MAG TPA: carboxypeptidase regulatory-like domain-containing protein, partial [Acidobacteriaceae bacterium]|nr:carboxypeptidase regulatory-like domain-containing protein [Acidobacteriaceae bacterium]
MTDRPDATLASFRLSSHTRFLWIAAILAYLCTATAAHAQSLLYGSLTGTVTDTSGAVIPGANVTAQNMQTGVTSTATTDSAGIYRFNALQPGSYKVTITGQGFASQQTAGVQVTVNETARLDAQLKVASATQQVIVTTQAPILQTDNADVHTDITSQQIENLPTFGSQGRNFQSLLIVVPGAGLPAETNSQAGNPQRAINANINGQSNQSIDWRIDGVQDAYPWLPANVAYVPPANAIANTQVATNNFLAEQGAAGGAAVNVEIKSGSNNFHGGVHEFYTSQHFQALNYFQGGLKKNVNIQHQYGGEIGGPIVKDKLFFFADFERTTQRQKAGPDVRTLPTAAMAAGDFRGLSGNPVIYDPATGDTHGAGKTQISCNGQANVICPSRIDPAAAAMVKLLQTDIAQETQTANGQANFAGSSTAYSNRENSDYKINWVPAQKSTVFGRYSFSKSLIFDPPLLGPAVGDATNGGQLGQAPGLVQNIGLGTTYAFSPSLLLDWNFGFTRQRLGSTFDLTSAKGLNDLKIPGTNNVGAPGDPALYYGLPGFVFPTGSAPPGTSNEIIASMGNAQPANPFLFRDQQFVTNLNLSWNKAKHAMKGGIEWNHSQINHFQPQGGTFQQPRGSFEFNGYVTSLQGTTPSWQNSWADFLLGLPSGTGKARALFNPNALRWSEWAWFAQDQWQLTPVLTLTLGLRWEYYPFGTSDNGKGLRLLDLNTGNVLLGGYGGVPVNDHL